jgi:recombinational DNA repair protein (RecF pathway)
MSNNFSGQRTTPSFVLRSFPVGDKSLMVYLFTLEHGVLHLFANISQKKKAMLRSFSKINIDYFGSGDKKKLKDIEVDLSDMSLYFKQGVWPYEILMSAYYLNELILKLLPKEISDPELFCLYERSLRELDVLSILQNEQNKSQNIGEDDMKQNLHLNLNMCLRSFEWRLLNTCGYGFDLKNDKDGNTIDPGFYYICSPAQLPELKCVKYKPSADLKQRLAGDIYLGEELIKINSGDWSDNNIKIALKSLMRKNIAYYTNGVKFESRVALQQYFKHKKIKA